MHIEWEEKEVSIDYLKGLSKNPRQISRKNALMLERSIEKYGLCQPIVVNKDFTIIGGHQRVAVMKRSGKKKCMCVVPSRELSNAEVDELNIRLNKNCGEWDYDILANEWDTDKLIDWGFDDSDFQIDLTSGEDKPPKEKKSKEKECPECGFKF